MISNKGLDRTGLSLSVKTNLVCIPVPAANRKSGGIALRVDVIGVRAALGNRVRALIDIRLGADYRARDRAPRRAR